LDFLDRLRITRMLDKSGQLKPDRLFDGKVAMV